MGVTYDVVVAGMRAFFNAPGDIWRVYLSNDCTMWKINRCFLPLRK